MSNKPLEEATHLISRLYESASAIAQVYGQLEYIKLCPKNMDESELDLHISNHGLKYIYNPNKIFYKSSRAGLEALGMNVNHFPEELPRSYKEIEDIFMFKILPFN